MTELIIFWRSMAENFYNFDTLIVRVSHQFLIDRGYFGLNFLFVDKGNWKSIGAEADAESFLGKKVPRVFHLKVYFYDPFRKVFLKFPPKYCPNLTKKKKKKSVEFTARS